MRALLAAATLFIGLAGPVSARDLVPFKGTLTGTVTVTPVNPPISSVAIDGSGAATQLGRFSLAATSVVNQALRTGSGSFVITAANGDIVTADFTGSGNLVAPGILSATESATITGGTGRFAGATGTFTVERTFFISSLTTIGAFHGWISVPAHR